ncbi:MAG: hypothetical protein H6668_11780 [Ardenticatenaceae bacterium]|nr:hypothetical protein [Ardenticatenaceae bacterium]
MVSQRAQQLAGQVDKDPHCGLILRKATKFPARAAWLLLCAIGSVSPAPTPVLTAPTWRKRLEKEYVFAAAY